MQVESLAPFAGAAPRWGQRTRELPVGACKLLRQIEGFHDFSEITEDLDVNNLGFGTKHAPWSWSMALTETLVEASWQPARADAKLCVKRRKATEKDGKCLNTNNPCIKNGAVPLGVSAAHVDDFKGACEETTR
eukprot:4259739-Pyramimonas_sp.AAC.1